MLDNDQILAIITDELSQSDTAVNFNNNDLEESLSLYLGKPDGNEVEGRSRVVSTDIADAIEWIMPQVMKSFTLNNEVVVFDPVHQGDEYQADLESQYVYEVLMKQNDGFLIIHQFVKDALMQRNGILKVYYSLMTTKKICDYTGITDEQFNALFAYEGLEVLEHTEYVDQEATIRKQQEIQQQMMMLQQQAQANPQMMQQAQMQMQQLQAELQKPVTLHNIKLSAERNKGKIYVDPVPPEEFRVNSQHNSICLDNARFTAHVTMKTVSDIIQEFDLSMEEAKDLPEGDTEYDTEYRFQLQEGSVFYEDGETLDPSQRQIEVSECYLQIDIDEVGISKYMKITVAGGDTPTDILSIEELGSSPWVATTGILMSHTFQGLSIKDRLKQIQEQKTALWRNILDNIYLQNNQRTIVVENQVNIDDLLVSRPGGIIRAKRIDAVAPFTTPQIHGDAFNMMNYLDQVRAGRVGVDPEGNASPEKVGDRVGSEGIQRLMNAKEELVGLIIRVIAETGIKPLCIKIRDLTIKHIDSVIDFRFRSQWYKLQPSAWEDRTMCTVRVGTGTGSNADRVMAIREVIGLQKEMLADQSGKASVLINHDSVYAAIDDYCKFAGLNGASRYFLDPTSEQGRQSIQAQQQSAQQNQQMQQQMQTAMAQAQMKLAEAEQMKAQGQIESAKMKAQIDFMKNQLTAQKQQYEAQMSALKQQLDEAKVIADKTQKDEQLEFQYYQSDQNAALKVTEMEMDADLELNKQYNENLRKASELAKQDDDERSEKD